MQNLQSVSTLMDGELNMDEAVREIARLKADASSRETWDTYHLIGDVLRGDASGRPGTAGVTKFPGRFSERLALEPTVLAPHTHVTRSLKNKFQTYALSAAASLAAFAVVGWVALSTVKTETTNGELAKALVTPPPQVVVLRPQATKRQLQFAKATDAASEHVHEYLLAHQGISPTTAIQGVTPYIRTVSSTGE